MFKPVMASDFSVSWLNGSNEARLDEQFDVNVRVTTDTPGTYYIRASDTNCLVEMLNSGTNGCIAEIDKMQPITVVTGNNSSDVTLRLKIGNTSSVGDYSINTYLYDLNKNQLAVSSSSYSIKINNRLPTNTPTSTPTLTPTPTLTLTPTPTKILTPTPTEAPIIEPTQIPEITKDPIIPTTEPIKELTVNTSENKESKNYLPIIFVGLGLMMFVIPILIPKIKAKIRFKKNEIPPIDPPKIDVIS